MQRFAQKIIYRAVAQTKYIYTQAAGPSGKVTHVDHWVALGMGGIRVGLLPVPSDSLTSPLMLALTLRLTLALTRACM